MATFRVRGTLTLDTRQFDSALRRSRSRAQRTARGLDTSFRGLDRTLRGVAATVATIFSIRAASNLLSLGEGVENLRLALTTLQGGAEGAQAALDELDRLSQSTRFNVGQLGEAFVRLGNSGLNTTENVEALANVATALGRDIQDVAAAIISLEADSLRLNFGLQRVERTGETFTATLQDGSKQVIQGTRNFQEFLLSLGRVGGQFEGAASQAADLFGTELANIQTTASLLSLQLRDILGPTLGEIAKDFRNLVEPILKLDEAQKKAIGQQVLDAYNQLKEDLKNISELNFDNLSPIGEAIAATAGIAGGTVAVKTSGSVLRNVGAIFQVLGGISTTIIALIAKFGSLGGAITAARAAANGLADRFFTVFANAKEIEAALDAGVKRVTLFSQQTIRLASRLGAIVTAVFSVSKGLEDALGISETLEFVFRKIKEVLAEFGIEGIADFIAVLLERVIALGRSFGNVFQILVRGLEAATELFVFLILKLDQLLSRIPLIGSFFEVAQADADRALNAFLETSEEIQGDFKDIGEAGKDLLSTSTESVDAFREALKKASQDAQKELEETAKKLEDTVGKGTEEQLENQEKAVEQAAKKTEEAAKKARELVEEINARPLEPVSITARVDSEQIAQEVVKLQEQLQNIPPIQVGENLNIGGGEGIPSAGITIDSSQAADIAEQNRLLIDRAERLRDLNIAFLTAQGGASALTEEIGRQTVVFGQAFTDAENNVFRAITVFDEAGNAISRTFQNLSSAAEDVNNKVNETGATLNFFKNQAQAVALSITQILAQLSVQDRLLVRQAQTLAILTSATGRTRDEITKLAAALAKGGEEATKARARLQQLVGEMQETAGTARRTSGELAALGQTAGSQTVNGLNAAANAASNLRSELAATETQANSTANAVSGVGGGGAGSSGGGGGAGRQVRNLGPVIQGDPNDPANIQRALTNITSQLQAVSRGGRDAFGFVNLQIRALAAERNRLQALLADAQRQQQQAITESIVNTFIGQGLTGDDLTRAVEEALAVRQRFGLNSGGTVRSEASYGAISGLGGGIVAG